MITSSAIFLSDLCKRENEDRNSSNPEVQHLLAIPSMYECLQFVHISFAHICLESTVYIGGSLYNQVFFVSCLGGVQSPRAAFVRFPQLLPSLMGRFCSFQLYLLFTWANWQSKQKEDSWKPLRNTEGSASVSRQGEKRWRIPPGIPYNYTCP